MDLEDAINMTSNKTEEAVYEYRLDFYERLFLELFTVVGLLSMTANILIIFVILKFKKLRQEATNIIIAHLSLLEAAYLLATPLTLRLNTLTMYDYRVHLTVVCTFYESEFTLSVAVCLFMFLLVSDWYLKTYNETRYAKFCRVYKFFVAGIYICTIFLCSVAIMLCFQDIYFVATMLCLFVCYTVLVIFLIVMNILHYVKKRRLRENKHNVGLVIANMFIVFWIPITVVLLLAIFRVRLSAEVAIIGFTVGLFSPIFNLLYLLYRVDVFGVFLRRVFRCQCNEYGNELLEDQTVTYSEESGIQIDKK